MRIVALASALASLSVPAAATGAAQNTATNPAIFQATLPEKASGFTTLAECERALGAVSKNGKRSHRATRGTAFNRAAGNISRCEMVDGEAVMVVYPASPERRDRPRPS